MTVETVPSAGYCYGIARAVNLATEAAPCCTLGPLLHNRHAVAGLESAGIRVIVALDELPECAVLIIRAHGAPPELYDELERRGVRYVDATCPDVARVHRLAREEHAAGRTVLLYGDPKHPEVTATAAWGNCVVVQNEDDLNQFFAKCNAFPESSPGTCSSDLPVTVMAQTTARYEDFEKLCGNVKKQYTNVKILDTICGTTVKRQRETAELSRRADVMVVVGDPASANTRHLASVCKCPVIFTDRAYPGLLRPYERSDRELAVGITAGASTPSAIIEEVVSLMTEEIKNTLPAQEDTELSFAELLEPTLRPLHTGDKVTGVITGISPTEIQVDLGSKHAAYIPLHELTDDPDVDPATLCKVGEEIETYVMRVNDVEGTVMLSKRRLDTVKSWEDVESAQESRAVLEGIVVEENKGGVVVSVKGVRVFVPASQTGLPKDAPMSSLIKKKVRLRVTEFHRSRRRVVGSIRSVSQEERRARAEDFWNTVEPGKLYHGFVKSLTSYGAFIDIGGVDGLAHMSELSWERLKSPADMLKVGDPLDVTVISVDKENRRISLRHKKEEDNPWNKFTGAYKVGDVVSVKVNKLMPFGAFAEVMPNVDGLIHISQITDHRIGKPADVLSEGDLLDVKITEIDMTRQKISLSARALMEPAEPENAESGPDEIVAISDETQTVVADDLTEDTE